MSKLMETPYMAYSFSKEEEPQAYVFTELQEMHIRTELAKAATERVTLASKPDNMAEFTHELEFLRGKMEGLAYLLALSEEYKNGLTEALKESAASQAKS